MSLGGSRTLTKDDGDGGKSVRSKRSLSIQVNKVSKIIKLAEDGATAISKPRLNNGRGDITGRHKSVGRVQSRGRGANGTAIFERNP
jgi:hypothetical protein